MKSAKTPQVLHWSGTPFEGSADRFLAENSLLASEHNVNEFQIPAIWAFKIFEAVSAVTPLSAEADLAKFKSLASVLGSGRISDSMKTDYWFEGRELANLHLGLCELQTKWITASRQEMERYLVRTIIEQPEPDTAQSWFQCGAKNQASIMVAVCGLFLTEVLECLSHGHPMYLSVS